MLGKLLLRIAGMTLTSIAADALMPECALKRSAMRAIGILETAVIAAPVIEAVFGLR